MYKKGRGGMTGGLPLAEVIEAEGEVARTAKGSRGLGPGFGESEGMCLQDGALGVVGGWMEQGLGVRLETALWGRARL